MRRAGLLLLLLLAGCGGAGDELPEAVERFERQLETGSGTLHVVTDEIRVLSEPHAPDLPPGGWSDEIWLDLGGAGWRAQRTTGDGGFVATDGPEGEAPDFLMRPWRAGIVVDPVRTVREGRLQVVGEATVRDRPAYLVTVDPDPSLNTLLYVARDDGDLLRLRHRRERGGRLRTIVQDYLLFEVDRREPPNLAELVGL